MHLLYMLIGCINGCPARELVILLFACRGPTRLLVQIEQTVENNMMSSLPLRMLTISASTFLQLEKLIDNWLY